MSATQSTLIATPVAAPAVPTSAKADAVVRLSNGLAQLAAFVKANPEVLIWFQQQFGTQLANMAHTTAGSFLGAILGWLFAHFGIQADPQLTVTLCGGGVLVGSLVWNGVVAMWRGTFSKSAAPVAPAVLPAASPTAQEIAQAVVEALKHMEQQSHPAAS